MVGIPLDSYVLDCLLPDLVGNDRRQTSFIVYLYLYRRSAEKSWSFRASHQSIATATWLSRSAVQIALAHLQTRHLISTARSHPTAVPLHRVLRPWLRLNRKK